MCRTGSAEPPPSVPGPRRFSVSPCSALLVPADVPGNTVLGARSLPWSSLPPPSRSIKKVGKCRVCPVGRRERPHKGSDGDLLQRQMSAWLWQDKPTSGSAGVCCLQAGPAKSRQAPGSDPGLRGSGLHHRGFSLSSACSSACIAPGNFRLQHFSPEEMLAIDLGIDIAK